MRAVSVGEPLAVVEIDLLGVRADDKSPEGESSEDDDPQDETSRAEGAEESVDVRAVSVGEPLTVVEIVLLGVVGGECLIIRKLGFTALSESAPDGTNCK